MIYAMKRLFIIAGCTLLCTLCGTFTTEAFAQSANQKDLKSYNQEQRAQRRAQRLADMEKYIDSIVLSRNFEFNPQTIQQQPAGTMQFITNTVYTVTLWRGSLDVCLPYYAGYVPPRPNRGGWYHSRPTYMLRPSTIPLPSRLMHVTAARHSP